MLIIGLTGGIGCGKTTVANYFKELGVPIINSDHIARKLVEPELPAYQAIVKHFGSQILTNNLQIDRAKLRQIIFNSPQEKIWLEFLLHPMIRECIEKEVKHLNYPYCIIEIPLLVETKFLPTINRVLVIECKPEQQLSRAQQRDSTKLEEVRQIYTMQADHKTRLNVADDIILNEGSLAELRQQVSTLHKSYLLISNDFQNL